MKKVEAIVQPFKLHEVKEALAEIGVMTLTVSEVQESDRFGRHTETYRGQEYTVDFTPRTRVEVVVSDDVVDDVIAVISRAARCDEITAAGANIHAVSHGYTTAEPDQRCGEPRTG